MTKGDRPAPGVEFYAPPITPEQLFHQDKLRMDRDNHERKIAREIARSKRLFPQFWTDREQPFG